MGWDDTLAFEPEASFSLKRHLTLLLPLPDSLATRGAARRCHALRHGTAVGKVLCVDGRSSTNLLNTGSGQCQLWDDHRGPGV